DCENIIQSLMVGEEHKSILVRDIFHAMGVYRDSSAPICAPVDILQKGIPFLLCILLHMGRIVTQLKPAIRNKQQVAQNHHKNPLHLLPLPYCSCLYSSTAVSYRLFPWESITTMTGKFSTSNFLTA